MNKSKRQYLQQVVRELGKLMAKHGATKAKIDEMRLGSSSGDADHGWRIATNAFDELPGDVIVSPVSAAAALGVTPQTLKRWRERTDGGTHPVVPELPRATGEAVSRNTGTAFRLQAIRDWGAKLEEVPEWHQQRLDEQANLREAERKSRLRLSDLDEVTRAKYRWLVDRSDVVIGMLPLATFAITPYRFEEGDRVETMTIREAIVDRQWRDADAHAVWATEYKKVLLHEQAEIATALERHESAKVADILQASLPSDLPAGGGKPPI